MVGRQTRVGICELASPLPCHFLKTLGCPLHFLSCCAYTHHFDSNMDILGQFRHSLKTFLFGQ